jgi:hypothetical protein
VAQPFQQRCGEWRAFLHDDDDLAVADRAGHLLLVVQVMVDGSHFDLAHDRRPVRRCQGGMLIIVEHGTPKLVHAP